MTLQPARYQAADLPDLYMLIGKVTLHMLRFH